jgi:HPt (histidine-containing phosphotransfer) domain-containing protein
MDCETGRLSAGSGQEDASAPIDRRHLARYTLGDRALEREVLQLFCGQAGRHLDDLRKAARLAQWSEAAHGLKGSAKAVGATRLAMAATRAESLAALDEDRTREACLKEIEAAIDEADRYIRSLP